MSQKRMEGIESHLCNRLKLLPFQSRKQLDGVYKFASLLVRNKSVGFYIADDSASGNFCDLALKYIKKIESLKEITLLEDVEKLKKVLEKQNEIERLIKENLEIITKEFK